VPHRGIPGSDHTFAKYSLLVFKLVEMIHRKVNTEKAHQRYRKKREKTVNIRE
jgi:hypothetical protein